MTIELIAPQARYFECSKCSFKFIKKITESASGIARCQNCSYPCLEYRLTKRLVKDEDIVKKMPIYQQLKYYWLKHPQAWLDNIAHRTTLNQTKQNTTTYLTDDAGVKLGEMPEMVEL